MGPLKKITNVIIALSRMQFIANNRLKKVRRKKFKSIVTKVRAGLKLHKVPYCKAINCRMRSKKHKPLRTMMNRLDRTDYECDCIRRNWNHHNNKVKNFSPEEQEVFYRVEASKGKPIEDCSICLEQINDEKPFYCLKCKNKFHFDCIQDLEKKFHENKNSDINKGVKCPLCRGNLCYQGEKEFNFTTDEDFLWFPKINSMYKY
jgi:hypothetical protein